MSVGFMKASNIQLKRIYLPASPTDGIRILVDRLWPRNLSKDKASIQYWFKEVAPSTELRHWFSHDPSKWDEFQRKYKEELKKSKPSELDTIRTLSDSNTVTLLYAAKDEEHNQAVVLRNFLVQA